MRETVYVLSSLNSDLLKCLVLWDIIFFNALPLTKANRILLILKMKNLDKNPAYNYRNYKLGERRHKSYLS